MKYFIMYLKLRITLFIATHFYMEPEYLKELYREFLEYGNSIPASCYMRHGRFMEYVYKLGKLVEAVP
jgi:hypothetical protein